MGTSRLAFAFVVGIIGIFLLIASLTPLFSGHVEFRATSVSIDSLESNGFPAADYLEITDGFVVFSEADSWLSDSDSDGSTLWRLAAPVVSAPLMRNWQASMRDGEPIDASRLRLVVSFDGDRVEELWPDVKHLAETGQALDVPPAPIDVKGDTEPGEYMMARPMQSNVPKTSLDWTQIRHMRFERHFNNPFRVFRRLAFGLVLLALAVATFRYHRTQPDDVTTNALDITPLFDDD